VAANAQRWRFECIANGFIRGGGPRHERCASQYALMMEFLDGAINALRESKIIRIDDQASHRTSLSTEAATYGAGGHRPGFYVAIIPNRRNQRNRPIPGVGAFPAARRSSRSLRAECQTASASRVLPG
jgi:hypothetical protein